MTFPGLVVRTPYNNSGSSNSNRNRNVHAEIVQIMDAATGWNRFASNYGTSGTGLDATGGINPSGEEAFVVYRSVSSSNPCDIIIKWSYNQFYAAGKLQVGASNWGVGIGVAFHSSSQAWNGTIVNGGTDTFPSATPWKSGSLVFPRQNANGGVHQTEGSREYVSMFLRDAPLGNLVSAVSNEHVFFAYNGTSQTQSSGKHNSIFYFGKYEPSTGSGDVNFPYVLYSSYNGNTQLQPNTIFGGTAESDTINCGISFNSASITDVFSFYTEYDFNVTNISSNNRTLPVSGTSLPVHPVSYILGEPAINNNFSGGQIGSVGYSNFFKVVRSDDVANLDTTDDDTTLFLSASVTAAGTANFIVIPWVSGTIRPTGSNTTKITSVLLPGLSGGSTLVPVYRGTLGGNYVYQNSTPPAGASNITIVDFV